MNKISMVENACRELLQYGVFDRRKKIENFIRQRLFHQLVAAERSEERRVGKEC